MASTTDTRDVRKVVTVLFCDLAGYTSTGDGLDPEALRALQSRYFEEARTALERHGGTVEKFIGDAVMAVFGIPVLHDDDALRALRAAVELRDAVAELGFQARIGVNTGEVVSGGGDALVTGDAVNVAARLEQAAEPGEILLGEPTLKLARDAVEVEPVEPLDLKGKAKVVLAHRLLRVVEGAPAFERRLDAPFVGRRDELARVRTAFDEARADRACRLVTAFGPPGIGKTRLAREVAASLEGEASVLVGRCLPYGEGITYWPLAEIFRQARAEDAWGVAVTAGAPEEVAWTVRKWLETRARTRPLALVFEDIHWAEPPLLDLIEHVADWTRDAPLLLLCLARPDFLDSRVAWGGDTITLQPLTADESDELIESLLGSAALDDGIRARIREVAEGNPLFVEQLLAMLADGAAPDEVPATIQALLAARLDGLPEEEREILERASVVGLDFEWDALGKLAPDGRRPPGPRLAALVRKELIRPHEAIDDTFRFRHMLIRDAAYDRVPKAQRADLHERSAGWLDGRGEEFEEIIGYHLEQAHGCLVELGPATERARELAQRAGRHLASSGRRAYDRGDLSAAADLLGRAVALFPHDDANRLPLLPMLGRSLTNLGEWEGAKALLTDAIEEATANGERIVAADATVALDYIKLHTELIISHDDVLPGLRDAIGVFEELGDTGGLARALTLLGNLRHWGGEAGPAVEDLDRAARLARAAGDRAQEAESLRNMLTAAISGPVDVDSMYRLIDDVRRRVPGSLRAEVGALTTEAELEAMRGNFDAGRERLATAVALAGELGLEVVLAATSSRAAGIVELTAGEFAAAERVLRAGCAALEQMGDWAHFASVVPYFVDALYALSRVGEAKAWVDLASRYELMDDLDAQIGVRRARAKLLAHRGDLEHATALAFEAVAMAEKTDFLDVHARACRDLAEVLRLDNRLDEASEVLTEALALEQRKGNLAGVERTRRTLAELAAQPPATA